MTRQTEALINKALKLDKMLEKIKSRVSEIDEVEGSRLNELLENN